MSKQTKIEVEKVEKVEAPKKVQKISVSYTLKSFGGNNKKLLDVGVIDAETFEKLEEIKKKAVSKWMESEF